MPGRPAEQLTQPNTTPTSPMPLIELESAESAVTKQQSRTLESLRDRFVQQNLIDFQDDTNLAPRLSNRLPFFALPEQQLLAYEKHREESELGHIFRIANGLHDSIDALVVTGQGGGWLGARGIAGACCDPYHNELTRAARGSKPRIYFPQPDLDNDELHSLLSRLTAGGYGDVQAERGWALIATDSPESQPPDNYLLGHLIELLINGNSATSDPRAVASLVTSIGVANNRTAKVLSEIGFNEQLFVPQHLRDAMSILTPVGLLPSAFLGFDCIQLLVGAAAVNENFRTAAYRDNLVLRYVASQQLASADHGQDLTGACLTPVFSWWPRGLNALDAWIGSLKEPGQQVCGRTSPVHSFDLASAREVDALRSGLETGSIDGDQLIVNHVIVKNIRTDPFSSVTLTTRQNPAAPSSTITDQTVPERTVFDDQNRRLLDVERFLGAVGVSQQRIVLPVIDTHSLGQLIQLLMLSNKIESMCRQGG